MKKLLDGILRFRAESQAEYREKYAHLSTEQLPSAMLITCADSRIVPYLVAGSQPGEHFVVRNAGNFAPRFAAEEGADSSVAAAVAFGVAHLAVKDIVICGHSNCGAMQALAAGRESLEEPSLKHWLRHGDEALETLRRKHGSGDDSVDVEALAKENVLVQMERVRTYPTVNQHGVRVHGFFFDLHAADVYVYDPGAQTFVVLDEEQARRIG